MKKGLITMNRDDVLYKAVETIQDRGESYGDASKSFIRIADMWGTFLDQRITPAEVAIMMIMLKIARLESSPNHSDSWIDICGYAALAGEITSESDNVNNRHPL